MSERRCSGNTALNAASNATPATSHASTIRARGSEREFERPSSAPPSPASAAGMTTACSAAAAWNASCAEIWRTIRIETPFST